uniref:ScyL1 n=1 Tax=Scytalidium album TaxID=1525810 RepID=A0A8A5D542_9PEZI|nr:ScyL1 [Scytalidium album]
MLSNIILSFSVSLFALTVAQTPPSFRPSCNQNLGITWPNNVSVTPGSPLLASDTSTQPSLSASIDLLKGDGEYLLVMLDPDVQFPQQPPTTILHWIQPSFQYNSTSFALTPTSDPRNEGVASYAGPHPPAGQIHRYILLLFIQPEEYTFPEDFERFLPADIPHRVDFDVTEFVKAAELAEPVAANYFTVEGLGLSSKEELKREVEGLSGFVLVP